MKELSNASNRAYFDLILTPREKRTKSLCVDFLVARINFLRNTIDKFGPSKKMDDNKSLTISTYELNCRILCVTANLSPGTPRVAESYIKENYSNQRG